VQIGFEVVMTGQGDGLAALFTLVHPELPVLNIDVLDPHGVGRGAPRRFRL
jgi:hypothetical protein